MSAPLRLRDAIVERESLAPTRSFGRWLYSFWSAFGFGDGVVYRTHEFVPLRAPSRTILDGNLSGTTLAPSSTTTLQLYATVPHDYFDGTDIIPYIVWFPDNADTGNVFWRFNHDIVGDGDVVSENEIDALQAGGGVANARQIQTLTPISGTSVKRGDTFLAALQRMGGLAGDTFTGNAVFGGVGFKYKARGIGTPISLPV